MATTPVFAFRYPVLGDAPNGPSAFQNLATDVETQINLTRYARVTSDVTKTSSTTLGNITGLSFTLAANAEYLMDGAVSFFSAGATADIKFAFTGPTGMTVSWNPGGPDITVSGTTVSTIDYYTAETYGAAVTIPAGSTSGGTVMTRPVGYWKTGATSGTLQYQFAQNTSSAQSTLIKRGSWLRLHRVA